MPSLITFLTRFVVKIKEFIMSAFCIYSIMRMIIKMAEINELIVQYLADKHGDVSKDMKIGKLRDLIDKYQSASPICKKECAVLAESVENRKIPRNIDELNDVLIFLKWGVCIEFTYQI